MSGSRPAGRLTGAVISWRRVLVVVIGTTTLACFSVGPLWSTDAVTAMIDALVAVSFVTTGVLLRDDRSQRGNALALIACGVFWLISWWSEWEVGPFPVLAECLGYLWFVFGGLALLRYPQTRLRRRRERAFFIGLGGWVCLSQLLLAFCSRPEWLGFRATVWWPTLAPNRSASSLLASLFYGVTGAAVVVMLGLLVAKLRHSRGVDRIDSIPVIVAAGSTAAGGGVYMTMSLLFPSTATLDTILQGIGLTALITPLAFLVVVLQRRLVRSSVADLVLRIGATGESTVGQMQDALRGVLRDPAAELWLWLPTLDRYVDEDGAVVTPPAGDRWSVPVLGRDDRPLALLVVTASLRRHGRLVESTVAASGLALENSRLYADLQRQLVDVRASRARIVEAGMAERRRIERDLHDGAQQSLLAAAAALGVARIHSARDPETVTAVDDARANVQRALCDLRDLARGIHPAVLSQSGLRPALEDVAECIPISVTIRVPEQRLPQRVESTIYFLVCEALANSVKHAAATGVSVQVLTELSSALVTICDDGRGGAVVAPGGGLRGIIDRVHALSGRLELDSRPGQGTTITVSLPCG